jgi:hypothetical protein
MNLGAEPKKVAILAGLLAVALVVFFINSSSGGDNSGYKPSTARSGAGSTASKTPGIAAPLDLPSAPPRQSRTAEREFRPSPKRKRGEAPPDPTTIDPTLRIDVLAKLQQVNVEGMHRSIFDFGQAPPPPEAPKTIAKGPKAPNPLLPKPAAPPANTAAAPPAAPQAPPVPLKFYGYVSPSNQPSKRAFFMEGEDIHVVREGDLVKNRYKIVRIGVNSVIVEDVQFKSQQTLPLEEQPS